MRDALLIIAAFGAAACANPETKFDDFKRRLGDPRVGAGAASSGAVGDAAACELDDAVGDYFLTLAVALSPQTPIVALVSLTTPSEDTVAMPSIQPLAASDRSSPIGSSISAGPFAAPDGQARVDVPGLRVNGAANPIAGSDIAADVVLLLNVCKGGPFLCGSAEGDVTEPLALDLAGSTFTMTRVASPVDYPEPPPINCAGDLADPL
jgi:hypothetical protein